MSENDSDFFTTLLSLFKRIHPLDRVQRAGYVLRGVAEPESVAAHSHFVSLLCLLIVDHYPEAFDRHKALAMALLHDLPEAVLMDIPMPASEEFLRKAKKRAERDVMGSLFTGLPQVYVQYQEELEARQSPEARLVAGLDKAQMMLKILCYQEEGRGRLEEFWRNPRNFADYGIEAVARLFEEICRAAGRERPLEADNRDFL